MIRIYRRYRFTTNVASSTRKSTQHDYQHSRGRLAPRERLELLLDDNSFTEHNASKSNGVITGNGLVNSRLVFVYAQDATIQGGSISPAHAKKICELMDLAASSNSPIIGLNESGGARIQDGVDALAGAGEIFKRNVRYSGVVPQISLMLGASAGASVYSPALTDFVIMTKNTSFMYITGPQVVKSVTNELVSHEELGGAEMHATLSGVATFAFENEFVCLAKTRELMGYLPLSNSTMNPIKPSIDSKYFRIIRDRVCTTLDYIIPRDADKAYDMKYVILKLVDAGEFFELMPEFAPNIIIGFGRLDGHSIGVVANQPLVSSGVLDINASIKAARFIRFCDCFNIPILTLVDVPGFLPGAQQEQSGIIKNGAKMLYAYAEATVPKITVITRKAYGGGYIVMGSKHLNGDLSYSWPDAEIAVMGFKSAAEIIHKGKTDKSIEQEYQRNSNPQVAVEAGYLDEIIKPSETRRRLIQDFKILNGKKQPIGIFKKHGNIPL